MNELRTALRERTQAAHQRLDGLFSGLDLREARHYGLFLAAQAAALEPVERALDAARAETVIPDWHERKRTAAIRGDLDALALAPAEEAGRADWIGDRASILGAAYVLEGSRLGGKMLLKVAASSADPAVVQATGFLAHGEGRRFWPSFDALLGATELSEAEVDRLVESAVRTFELFELCARETLEPAGA